jgi:pSer/pThr/pTyr-binding forkhead associated (FHA) protein
MSANPPADEGLVSDLRARAEAERAGRPFLLYLDGDGRQQLFVFEPDAALASVGRQPSADLVIDWDDQVSRLHAQFERVQGRWELVDDGLSRNGTFVNDERLSGRRRLGDGDVIRFGTTAATFRSPKPEPKRRDAPAVAETPPDVGPPDVGLSTTQRRVLVALCRPYKDRGGFASPATDEQIAEELFLSVSAVRTHLRVLYAKLGLTEQPHNDLRVRLVEHALLVGIVSERDL